MIILVIKMKKNCVYYDLYTNRRSADKNIFQMSENEPRIIRETCPRDEVDYCYDYNQVRDLAENGYKTIEPCDFKVGPLIEKFKYFREEIPESKSDFDIEKEKLRQYKIRSRSHLEDLKRQEREQNYCTYYNLSNGKSHQMSLDDIDPSFVQVECQNQRYCYNEDELTDWINESKKSYLPPCNLPIPQEMKRDFPPNRLHEDLKLEKLKQRIEKKSKYKVKPKFKFQFNPDKYTY